MSRMSSDSIADSKESSKTTSTDCETGSQPESGSTDSWNSLLEKSTLDGKTEDCIDVGCTMDMNQCASCEEPGTKKVHGSLCCNTVTQCVWGVILLLMSVGGFIFTPMDFMLWEKLNMRPGFPPYEWWADPPDEVRLRVYVFNVTNHERFLSGLDEKLNIQEIGPIVYLEKLLHYNITFNENSTMTYTARRFPVYLPEENTIDMNATLIVPNLAVLGLSSYLYNAPFLVRAGLRLIVHTQGSHFFLNKTVHEYLWDYQEPVLDLSKHMVPGLVPVNNMGMLARIYSDFTDEVTVYIGPEWGHDHFFKIHRFRGQPQLPGYNPNTCPDRIFGSTEGVLYQQRLEKSDVLLYWRKTVCKLMPLYFDRELTIDNVLVYRYNLSESVFERVKNGTDCYDTYPTLPAGISDGSKCYYDFPMVISYPHFYTGEPTKDMYVTGLQPDKYKHNSYAIVEPPRARAAVAGTILWHDRLQATNRFKNCTVFSTFVLALTELSVENSTQNRTPFSSVARMQSNLRINDLSGFSAEYKRFSNLIVPLFWAEYNQEGLPTRISLTIYFMTVILPPLSTTLLSITLLIGCYLLAKQIYINKLQSDSLNTALAFKNKKANSLKLAKNKILLYESEKFIKQPS